MVMFSADEDEKIELDDEDEEMDKVQEEAKEAEDEEIEIVFEREDEEPEEEAPDPNPRLERELARLQDYNAPGNMDDMMVHDENERIFTRSQARRETNDDEVANLAASIFGSDFAMVAKTEVFLEDKPEGMKEQLKLEKKHLLEQLEETKSDKQMSELEKEKRIRVIVGLLKDEMPKTFREAWDHPDSLMKDRWRAAIQKEFSDMNKRQVWRVIEKVKVPKNRRL
eukprot:scaffold6464_cov57-Cylindrotheca_fusiformis.AAC.1